MTKVMISISLFIVVVFNTNYSWGLSEISDSELESQWAKSGSRFPPKYCMAQNNESNPPSLDAPQFKIVFGIFEGNEYLCDFKIRSTKKIPYILGHDNLKFGFFVTPKTENEYATRAVLYMPSATGEQPSIEFSSIERGLSVAVAWLTEGDQRGTYRMEFYINKSIAADVTFEVQ